MTRRDWLLLLVAADDDVDLDPVRVQKGLFLLAQEGGIPAEQRYAFVPYNYGPMSARVYRDADALVRRGLLERVPQPGYAWGRLRATPDGRARAAALRGGAQPVEQAALGRLTEIHRLVTSLGFAELLETIYERYPTFAARSVFRRP
jgi:uncharacterized protein YwgA